MMQARINQDGNLFGRIAALAVIGITLFYGARVIGPRVCPTQVQGKGCCFTPH